MPRDRAKAEADLFEHVRKATTPVEVAPKQKHVRSCIVFAWDYQTSVPFWMALKMQPVYVEQVPCFKALITIHKMLAGGPSIVLAEALKEAAYFNTCMLQAGSNMGLGYGPLICSYIEFLHAKLEFHRTHAEFTGNFDYEEYISLKRVSNLDEGYTTITELMELQGKLDAFQKTVFSQFRPSVGNECRIASLVPLVEESYGIYKFMTSMLTALYLAVDSTDPLMPLQERYNSLFWDLKKFYQNCKNLRYLTSLITIPELPEMPPNFLDANPSTAKGQELYQKQAEPAAREPTPPPKEPTPPPEPVEDTADLLDIDKLVVSSQSATQALTGVSIQQPPQHALNYRQEEQITYQHITQQMNSMLYEMQQARYQHQQDQELLQQYYARLAEAQNQIDLLQMRLADQDKSKAGYVKTLEDQVALWKSKYEKMAELYQSLRAEHLDLLAKFKEASKDKQAVADVEVLGREIEALKMESTSVQMQKDAENAKLASKNSELAIKNQELASAIEELKEKVRATEETLGKKGETAANQAGDLLAAEMLKAAKTIEEAAVRLAMLRDKPVNTSLSSSRLAVNDAILQSAGVMTGALGTLIYHATQVQQEIVAAGKATSESPSLFYRQNSEWTEGLISAAKAVASSTWTLVDVTDGVLSGKYSPDHMIVASNEVGQSTIRLVTAARVKAIPGSAKVEHLESAATEVKEANRRLIEAANAILGLAGANDETYSLQRPSTEHEAITLQMEQQVRIKELERTLQREQQTLAQLRKAEYERPALPLFANAAQPKQSDGKTEHLEGPKPA